MPSWDRRTCNFTITSGWNYVSCGHFFRNKSNFIILKQQKYSVNPEYSRFTNNTHALYSVKGPEPVASPLIMDSRHKSQCMTRNRSNFINLVDDNATQTSSLNKASIIYILSPRLYRRRIGIVFDGETIIGKEPLMPSKQTILHKRL